MIYFIRQNEEVKIGYTQNIETRLADLQVASPFELSVMLLIEGDLELESELHRTFEDYRIRGEWYWLNDDMKKFIASQYNNDLRYDHGLLDGENIDISIQTTFIRNKHALPLRVVGERMNITAQSVREIEKRELYGTVSLNVLRNYAAAMGYELQYKFVKIRDDEPELFPTMDVHN